MKKGRLVLFAAVLLLGACGKGEKTEVPDDTDRLYNGTLSLVRAFADSISNAPESAAARNAFVRFNDALDSLNFAVEPNTDLLLTEAENDTVCSQILRLKELYEKRIYQLGHPVEETPDSLTNQQG